MANKLTNLILLISLPRWQRDDKREKEMIQKE